MPFRFTATLRPVPLALLICLSSLGLLPMVPRSLHADPALTARPVSVQELCLLLHGGYTGDEVLRETAGRPLLGPLDAAAEKALRTAGADTRFVDALRTTRRALTDTEADAARQRQATVDARNTEGKAAYVSRMVEANKQALTNHLVERKQETLTRMAGRFHGKLVALRDDQLQPCADEAVANKKLFAFYFAAARSAPCRQFTPALVKFYQNFAPKHTEFEVILVSQDRSAAEMESDLRQNAMPWPALAYDLRAQEPNLMRMAEEGLPRLVLIDGAGSLLSDSFVEGKYVGPQHVLDDLAKLAAAGSN